MYILSTDQKLILDSRFVKRFFIIRHPECSLIVAAYRQDQPPITIGRYPKDEANEVLLNLFQALADDKAAYILPDSTLRFAEYHKKDARQKRKGGA